MVVVVVRYGGEMDGWEGDGDRRLMMVVDGS